MKNLKKGMGKVVVFALFIIIFMPLTFASYIKVYLPNMTGGNAWNGTSIAEPPLNLLAITSAYTQANLDNISSDDADYVSQGGTAAGVDCSALTLTTCASHPNGDGCSNYYQGASQCTNGGINCEVGPPCALFATHKIRFKISESSDIIHNLSVRVLANSSVDTDGTPIKLYAWNHSSSSFVLISENNTCTKCNLTAQLNKTSDFVNSSGDLYLAIQNDVPPANNSIYYAEARLNATARPIITLDYPNNDTYFSNRTGIYFNFTATDSLGLSTCQLWENFTGTWRINHTWIKTESAVQNYTRINLTDVVNKTWNVWCNNTDNVGAWNSTNYTISTINIEVNLSNGTTTTDSNVVTINVSMNPKLKKCRYTITNSSGGYDINASGSNNTNVSFACNSTNLTIIIYSITDVWAEGGGAGGTPYTITVDAEDEAGNPSSNTYVVIIYKSSTSMGGAPPEPPITVVGSNLSEILWCGDGKCTVGEAWETCPEDCGQFNLDTFTINCLDNNPDTKCILGQAGVLVWLFLIVVVIVAISIYYKSSKKKEKKGAVYYG